MKRLVLISATILFLSFSSIAQINSYNRIWTVREYFPGINSNQDLRFEVRGRYSRPVKKEMLNQSKYIYDFIPGYPKNWITSYITAEISVVSNGNVLKAVSSTDLLTTAQKNILNEADLATDIGIIVKYEYWNPANGKTENRIINISLTVVPEIEATYFDGYRQLREYIKQNIIDRFSEVTPAQYQHAEALFTINEEGAIVNTKISQTSGDGKTDKMLIDLINKMPKWKPAQNSKGMKVKQEFVFSVGNGGC